MDPILEQASLELGQVFARNSAEIIRSKVRAVKARRDDKDTITELDEIINALLLDKSDLLRIARSFEERLVAQRIQDEDVQYISENVVPALRALAASTGQQGLDWLSSVEALLSTETVTILQLLGFSFQQAIGGPLTDLVAAFIRRAAPLTPSEQVELQKTQAAQLTAIAQVARDPQSTKRFRDITQ